MPSSHCGYTAWGEGRGEGQLKVPLTPTLSPSLERDREQEGWGEGGPGCIAGWDDAPWPVLPAVRTNCDDTITPCAKAVEGYRTPRREAFSGAQMLRQVVLGAPKPGEGGECASPLALFPMGNPHLAPMAVVRGDGKLN
jgi:hypothetical protein